MYSSVRMRAQRERNSLGRRSRPREGPQAQLTTIPLKTYSQAGISH